MIYFMFRGQEVKINYTHFRLNIVWSFDDPVLNEIQITELEEELILEAIIYSIEES